MEKERQREKDREMRERNCWTQIISTHFLQALDDNSNTQTICIRLQWWKQESPALGWQWHKTCLSPITTYTSSSLGCSGCSVCVCVCVWTPTGRYWSQEVRVCVWEHGLPQPLPEDWWFNELAAVVLQSALGPLSPGNITQGGGSVWLSFKQPLCEICL